MSKIGTAKAVYSSKPSKTGERKTAKAVYTLDKDYILNKYKGIDFRKSDAPEIYKKAVQQDRWEKGGFGTLQVDLENTNKTVRDLYGGWQTKESMDRAKPIVQATYNKLLSFQNYNADFGDGSVDVSELVNSYKTILDGWDERTELYGRYKNADAYNGDVKNSELSDKFRVKTGTNKETGEDEYRGLTYDEVQAKLKKYKPDSDEYEFLSRYTGYTDLEDFDKAIKNHTPTKEENELATIKAERDAYLKEYKDKGGYIPSASHYNRPAYSQIEDYHEYQKKMNEYDKRIKELEGNGYLTKLETARNLWELENGVCDFYKDVESNKDFEEKSQYVPSNDDTYEYINGDAAKRSQILQNYYTPTYNFSPNASANEVPFTPPSHYEKGSYDQLTKREIKIYNYLYATKGRESAAKFLTEMQTTLNKRSTEKLESDIAKEIDEDVWASIGYSLLSIPMNIAGGIASAGDYITGNTNPYSTNKLASNMATTIRTEVGENIAESTEGFELFGQNILSFLYQTGMSMGDTALGGATLGAGYSVIAGSSAFHQKHRELIEAGENSDVALKGALASGAAEVIFEYISLDKLLKIDGVDGLKKGIKAAAKQAGIEASEEFCTELTNIISDEAIRGESSELNKFRKDLKARGYSESEINTEVAKKIGGQLGWAVAGGFLSGGVMGAGASIIAYNNMRSIGKVVRSKNGISDVLDIVASSPQELNSRKVYDKYSKKGVTAHNITNAQIGSLYATLYADTQNIKSSKKSTAQQKENASNIQNTLQNIISQKKTNNATQTGGIATLTEEETQLLNTPDAELTVEQRAEKQSIIERQQSVNNPSLGAKAESNNSPQIENPLQADADNGIINNVDNASIESRFSPEEKQAAILDYKSGTAYRINGLLRVGAKLDNSEQEFVNTLDEALRELPAYEGEVYRNLTFDDIGGQEAFDAFLEQHSVDKLVYYNQFTSCSTKADGYPVEGDYRVYMVVDGKSARDVDGYGNNMESEVIFTIGSAFLVTKVDTNGQYPIIHLQEVVTNEQQISLERSNAVRDMQELHTENGDLQSVSKRDTTRNSIRSVRPQSAASGRQGNNVRARGGQDTLLPAESPKSLENEADPEGPANFMPEGENTDGESVRADGERGFGLTDPTDQEIYRDPTDEENAEAIFGKRKNAKQRHILDVAKKLDSGMKVVFVSENARVLSGQKGVYMRESNTIYLSESNSVVDSYYQVFKHEFIHRLESKGAYQSFKNYLFRHSVAFEKYVRSQLGKDFKGTREEALRALAQHYIDTVQKGSFSEKYKKSFNEEAAQREMVADFISEVLFKGDRNDVAQSLAEGDIDSILDIEDALAEFENLNDTDRNWFQKIVDWVRDLIASLKGVKQNERLVKDLEYIEQRISRVLDSRDTKKAAKNSGGIMYCLREKTPNDFNPKGKSLNEQLEDAYETSDSFDQRYVYVGIFSKDFVELLKKNNIILHNYPIAMNYRDAYLSMRSKETGKYHGEGINYHNLGIDGLREALESFKNPQHIMKSKKDGKIELALQTVDKKGNNILSIIAINTVTLNGNKMLNAHIVTSVYGKRNIENYISKARNEGRIIEPNKEEFSQGTPQVQYEGSINENSSNDIILNPESDVKDIISEETENYSETDEKGEGPFSLGSPAQQMRDNRKRYENGEITQEEYQEETDNLWGKANEIYGMFETGENAKAPIATPKAVAEDKPTERFTRTIIETGKLTDEMLEGIEEKVLLGDFSYEIISDEKAQKKADSAVQNGTAGDIWLDTVNGSKITKNQVAVGERLLKDAIDSGDTKRVLELSAELADIFTRAGQVVQAARLLKKMTGAGRLVSLQRTVKTLNKNLRQKHGEDFPAIKISEGAARRLAEAKTQDGIEHAYQEAMQEVAEQVPVTFLDKWNAWRYFAMLSNPKTHIRNVVGNAIFTPAVRIKYLIAAVSELGVDQSKRTKSVVIKKEYRNFAKKDCKDAGVKNLLKGNKYNDKSALREKQRIFKSEVLEFLSRFNSNALEAEDMLFKNKHYIHALAGFLQARGVDLKNISQEILDEARIYAVEEAKKATFNDESALANWVQNFGNKNLATNIMVEGVLPFKRTPINIVKRGIEYSPLGLTKTLTKGLFDVKKGNITVTEFIDGLASGLTGTGIMLVGMFLASLGCVTGGEDDDEESKFEKLIGKQEYAVEILGNSYTIDWAAPANIPFFIGVEIVNTINEGEEFSLSQLGNAVWNSLEPITNLSMLSGMQSVIESARYAEPSQTLAAIASDAITSYAMQAVPSLSGAVARTIDQTQRSWYTDKNSKWFDSTTQAVKNNIQSKIPGLSYTQIPKIDAWGREVSRGGVTERVLENFVSPGYYSKIDYTETDKELKRLFVKTGVNVFPKIAAKNFELDGKTKHLTAQEYVTYAKAKGAFSFDYINEFIQSAAYKRLTDEERADVIEGLYKFSNAKAKTTVSKYDLTKQFKTVTNWEKNGNSAVDYYISRAISK